MTSLAFALALQLTPYLAPYTLAPALCDTDEHCDALVSPQITVEPGTWTPVDVNAHECDQW